jgi:DNA polymerase elongation subunit (family B)
MYQNIYFQREKNLMHLWDDNLGYRTFPYTRYAYKKATHGEYTSIYGDRLTKVYKYSKDDTDLFESDVAETTRVLVDLYTDSDIPSTGHRVLVYDIEVEMESGLPDPTIASNGITSIALHDSVSNHYWVLILDENGKLQKKQTDTTTVIPFSTERQLLETYLDLYEQINPSIVTGWNIDYFDTPYLYNRLTNVLGESHAKRLSPIGQCFYSPYRQRYFIAGVSYLDYLTLYKNYTYVELANYRLDTVGQTELKEGKIEYSGNLDDLFRDDIDKFIQYNLVDVELIVKLDRKLQFIDLARAICHAGHVPYEDFVYSSKYLEGALLTYLKKKKRVAPNKPADRKERMEALKEAGEDKFIGAYVKDPIVGKYNWIYDLDLTSLYPSIIMTLNISPETIIGKVDGWDAEKFYRGEVDWYTFEGESLSRENLKLLLEENNCSIASNGVLYRQDVVGCIPDILDHWFNQRVEFRKLEKQYGTDGNTEKYIFYKQRQLVQKILLNSLYGVLGLPAFRFYNIANAEAVTLTGQTIIKRTADIVNVKYNKELGGTPLVLEMVDGSSVDVYPNTLVMIKRAGIQLTIPAKELKEDDDFIGKVGLTESKTFD